MSDVIAWGAAPLTVTIALDDDERPRLVGFGPAVVSQPIEKALPPVELELLGAAKGRGSRHVEQAASARLRYTGHDAADDRLVLRLTDPETGLLVTQTWQRSGDAPVLRCHAAVTNEGSAPVTLRYVSSLVVSGFGGGDGPHWTSRLRLSYASMDTCAEFRWRTVSPADLGLLDVGIAGSTRRRIAFTGLGSTPSGEFLPAGAVTDTATGTAVVWQIEHNGAWHWEAGDHLSRGYLAVSGPTEQEHEWRQVLRPGETFRSVPVAVTASADGVTGAFAALTAHRRAIRRPHPDNDALPVVFNDYLNCLWGDPAEEKLLPIIDAAAKAGCEVFCVDAGWYSDEQSWWSSVGEWLPSASRFPSGLPSVLDRIAALGMVPGLWLEPEVVGVDSPVADRLPREAFFQRDGHRVDERGRYQLDLRHPAARAHLDAVVDRLVTDYGVGYLKFDYNINIGAGTDVDADGPGAGLLGHNRAYLRWVAEVLDRHPGLTIESCAGGGARTDYATLSLHSIQSTSDQADHLRTVPIAAAAATAIAPEQAGVWVSPRPEVSLAETELCVVNGLLGRMHVSGRPDLLSDEQFAAVASGLAIYKGLRGLVREGLPLWPLGLPGWSDDWVSYGLRAGSTTLLAVWRRGGSDAVELPLPHLRGVAVTVSCAYPDAAAVDHRWDPGAGVLTVTLPNPQAARLLRLVHNRQGAV